MPADEKTEIDVVRAELLRSAQRKFRRAYGWPLDWAPTTVTDPDCPYGSPFTEERAWQLIIHLLQSGHHLEEKVLDDGKPAFVMLVNLQAGKPPLYVKLQRGPGTVIARSFHYSKKDRAD